MKKASLKKTLGGFGSGELFLIAGYAAYKNIHDVEILKVCFQAIGLLVVGLLGLKLGTGFLNRKKEEKKEDE